MSCDKSDCCFLQRKKVPSSPGAQVSFPEDGSVVETPDSSSDILLSKKANSRYIHKHHSLPIFLKHINN